MPSVKQLDEMSRMEIDKIDRNTLVDINGVSIDADLPISERMQSYIEQIKNPYCFLCGDTPVRVCFSSSSQDLNIKIKSFFTGLKNR